MTPSNSIPSGPLLQERPSRAPGPVRLGSPVIVGCGCHGRRRPLDARRDEPGRFRPAFHVGTQRDIPGDAERDGYDRAGGPTQKPVPPMGGRWHGEKTGLLWARERGSCSVLAALAARFLTQQDPKGARCEGSAASGIHETWQERPATASPTRVAETTGCPLMHGSSGSRAPRWPLV